MNPRIDYSKCIRIIESCITLKQLQGAIQYSRLALRNESYFNDSLLLKLCKEQREKILQTELNKRYEAML